jgi:deoxyadenosine/deoxycytidine kinase
MARIVVEGPIGVGKTSLTHALADALAAKTVLEVVEENPFLARFYDDPERHSFSVQAFFLVSRFKQAQELNQGFLFQSHVVSDYMFDKDWIFASLNLQGDEWTLYEDLYHQLKPKLTPPDLTVYLRADVDLLLRRIAKRDRPFERDIDPDYLARLCASYDAYFEDHGGPLHVIEADSVDFVASRRDRDAVLADVLKLAKVA